MGDLKTNWTNAVLPDHGLEGQGILSSGNDPNAEGGDGAAGIKDFWPADKQATTATEMAESANSVSGLPARPNRWEPSDDLPEIPDLTDRSPGTIDKA